MNNYQTLLIKHVWEKITGQYKHNTKNQLGFRRNGHYINSGKSIVGREKHTRGIFLVTKFFGLKKKVSVSSSYQLFTLHRTENSKTIMKAFVYLVSSIESICLLCKTFAASQASIIGKKRRQVPTHKMSSK